MAQLIAGTTLDDWQTKHAQPAEKAPDGILRVLGEAGCPLDAEAISDRLDMCHHHIRSLMPKLIRDGKVVRHGQRSKYSRFTYELAKGSDGR